MKLPKDKITQVELREIKRFGKVIDFQYLQGHIEATKEDYGKGRGNFGEGSTLDRHSRPRRKGWLTRRVNKMKAVQLPSKPDMGIAR